jgi:hypothetical protein
MRGRARDGLTPYTPPHETLAATSSSQPNSEALAACVVLAHPHVVLYPSTCGLRRGIVAVAVVLIGYDDIKVTLKMSTRRR